jgi:hypothetical protein
MQSLRATALVVVVGACLTACNDEGSFETHRQPGPLFSSVQPASTGGLTLSLKAKKTAFGMDYYTLQGVPVYDTISLTISGGTPPYLARWWIRKCNTIAGCDPQYRDGGSHSFVPYRVDKTHVKTDFVVQVRRSAADSSSVVKLTLYGPSEPQVGMLYVPFQCSAAPSVGWTNPFDRNSPSGSCGATPGGTCYRRNACTAVRECYGGGSACQR